MFASSYVWSRPSRSPPLYGLGAGFADFLQSTRPDSGGAPGAIEATPANLAALERAGAEVYRARGLEDDAARHAAVAAPPTSSCGPRGLRPHDACAAAQSATACDAAGIWAKLLLWMPAALDASLVTMTK